MDNYYIDECMEILYTLNYISQDKKLYELILINNNQFMKIIEKIDDIPNRISKEILYLSWIESTIHILNNIKSNTKIDSLIEFNVFKICQASLLNKADSLKKMI